MPSAQFASEVKSGPWFLNLDLGEAQEVTGFQYSIYQATEAPKKFELSESNYVEDDFDEFDA